MNEFILNILFFIQTHSYILVIVGIWDVIWKGLALWQAAQHKQRNWFIAIIIVNSVGILPMVYLKFFQTKAKIKKTTRKS